MLEDVANLKPIGAHELELIRDIYLPLHADTHGNAAIGMDAAIAFTGTPHARRLFVPESRDVMDHLFRVVEAVDIELQKGATRFRVETAAATAPSADKVPPAGTSSSASCRPRCRCSTSCRCQPRGGG